MGVDTSHINIQLFLSRIYKFTNWYTTSLYIHTYIHAYAYTHTYMSIHTHTHTHTCPYTCIFGGGSSDCEITPHNECVVPHCLASHIILICPNTQRTVLIKPHQPLPLHLLAAEPPIPASTETSLVTSFLYHLFRAGPSLAGADCDVLLPPYLGDQGTSPSRSPKITRWAAFVGPCDDWPSKTVLFGRE